LTTRLSALRPPYFIWGSFRAVACQKLGREQKTRRENDAAFPHPLRG
jgi:hypothetical protein